MEHHGQITKKRSNGHAHMANINKTANEILHNGKKLVNEIYEEGKCCANEAQKMVKDYSDTIVNKVQNKPISSLIVGGILGFLLYSLLKK